MKKLTYYLLTIKGYSIKINRCKTIAKVKRLIKLGKVYNVTRVTQIRHKIILETIYRDSKSRPLNKIRA